MKMRLLGWLDAAAMWSCWLLRHPRACAIANRWVNSAWGRTYNDAVADKQR